MLVFLQYCFFHSLKIVGFIFALFVSSDVKSSLEILYKTIKKNITVI